MTQELQVMFTLIKNITQKAIKWHCNVIYYHKAMTWTDGQANMLFLTYVTDASPN